MFKKVVDIFKANRPTIAKEGIIVACAILGLVVVAVMEASKNQDNAAVAQVEDQQVLSAE